jgi:molybdopterin-guanine dinucleotide biosynthesis protein A
MGGVDKAVLAVGGRPMLHRVLAVVADASPLVVVGPPRDGLPAGVLQVREEPPGGGPVAAAAAGLSALADGVGTVALLASDLPFLTTGAVGALRAAVNASTVDGAVAVDGTGRRQLLCGVWRAAAVRGALAELGDPNGASMRALTAGLRVAEVRLPDPDPGARPPPWYDCDTEDDLRRAEEWSP